MNQPAVHPDSPRALVRVLAELLCTHARDAQAESRMLRELDVYQRVGLAEAAFEREVAHARQTTGAALAQHGAPSLSELEAFDAALDLVRDAHHRLWVCRVASCLITLDGHIEPIESMLYDRMLARWGHTRSSISRAILEDHAH